MEALLIVLQQPINSNQQKGKKIKWMKKGVMINKYTLSQKLIDAGKTSLRLPIN